MAAGKAINRISQILKESGLSWLLPNIRQDIVVWGALNDAALVDRVTQLHPSYSDYRPKDFSPSKLAHLASDLCDIARVNLDQPLDSMDRQFTQVVNNNRLPLLSAAVKELASADSSALTWLNQFNQTKSWNGLLSDVRENINQEWKSIIACLYGLLEDPIELLRRLIQSEGSGLMPDLAVHAVLSNPFTTNEQLAILVDLCHEVSGDPVPPSSRLSLIHALSQQRPRMAIDFSSKWLEIETNAPKTEVRGHHDTVEMVNQLLENIFQEEIRRHAGVGGDLVDYIESGLTASHELYTHLFARYLDQNSKRLSDKKHLDDILEICDHVTKLNEHNPTKYPPRTGQAELAIVLSNQGFYEEAKRLLLTSDGSLPDDVYVLFAIARVVFLQGDLINSWKAVSKIVELLDKKSIVLPATTRDEGLSLIDLAQLLTGLDKYSEAARVLEIALNESPNEIDLLEMLSGSYKILNQDQKVADTLFALITLNPDDLNHRREYAKSLERLGDWEASLNEWWTIIDSHPEETSSASILDKYDYIHCAIQARKPESALKVCDEILNLNQNDSRAVIYSGKAYLLLDDVNHGMEFLIRATKIAPASPEAWIALVAAQKDIHPHSEVIETLKSAIAAVPSSGEVHYLLGDIYLQDNEPSLALVELQTAVELSPNDAKILTAYGGALKSLGQLDLSRESYSKAYRLQPDYPGLAQNYADILLDMENLEEAIGPLETLINLPTNPDPDRYLQYARCALTLHKQGSAAGSPMKALIALNQALQNNPENAEAKALTAEALTANGDNELAFQAYREALDTSLSQDSEWFERLSFGFGCVASAIGKPDIAIAALQEASQVNSNNPDIYMALSDAYISANLPEEAVKTARNVLALEGDNPDRLAWFANQAAKLGGDKRHEVFNSTTSISKEVTTEALSALDKAIQLAPTRGDLVVQLGYFQVSIGERADAQITLKSIVEMDFATPGDLKSAARCLSEIGDHPSAIACLTKGIALDQCSDGEHDSALYTRLAHEYVKNNEHLSAIDTLNKALIILPDDNSIILFKVEILLDQGKSLDALNLIETTLQKNLNSKFAADLLFLASRINRSLGEFPGAFKYARMGIECANKGIKGEQISSIDLAYRAQIAEIYRTLLQPEQALQILFAEHEIKPADFQDEQGYLDFVFLQTELALEIGGRIPPNIQDIKLDASHPSYSRCMAINSRLMIKAGNYKQAEQFYQLAASEPHENVSLTTSTGWWVPHSNHLTLISLIEAAQDLGLWDQAMTMTQQVAESYADEPISQLYIAKTLVLKAEFAHLCEILEVVNHKPSNDDRMIDSYESCKQSLDRAKNLLDHYLCSETLTENELSAHQIYRWQARAFSIFNHEGEAKNDLVEILTNQATPDDIASLIRFLQQRAPNDPASENLSDSIKLARTFPRNPSVILQVAMALQESNPDDALRSLQFILEHNPYAKNPHIAFCNILLAKIGLSLGEFDVARQAVEKSILIWSDEPCWHRLAAQIYMRINDFIHAAQHLRDASRLAPADITYHLDLGKLLLENAMDDTNILNDGRISFEHVLELEPNNLPALISLVNTYYQLNDYEKAESYGRNALSLAPDKADLYQLLCKVAIEKNDYQSAYEYATKAVQINPSDVQSSVSLAKSLSSMGRYAEALSKLNTVIPLVQEAKALHLERVNIIRKIYGPQVALNELKSLTRVYPDDFTTLSALSNLFFEVGELENAVIIAKQALGAHAGKVSPNEQANMHLLIGQVFRHTGQLDQSIQHLNDAIQLAPNRLEPYLELGLARKEQREYLEALQIFERATLLAPNDPRAPYQAGLALKESKDYKSSEKMLRRAVSLAPNDLAIRRQLAAVVALNLIHNPRAARNNVK